MSDLSSVGVLSVVITSFGWLLHEMHRLRDMISDVQKDIAVIRIYIDMVNGDSLSEDELIKKNVRKLR